MYKTGQVKRGQRKKGEEREGTIYTVRCLGTEVERHDGREGEIFTSSEGLKNLFTLSNHEPEFQLVCITKWLRHEYGNNLHYCELKLYLT